MKMVVIGDVHGKVEKLQEIMDDIHDKEFDLIISQGDFTDMFDVTPDFTQIEIADIIIQKLLICGKPVLCVPGNHDPFEILDVFEEYDVNIHHKNLKINGISFVGWGGAETPFNTHFEPSEEDTEEALGKLVSDVKNPWILITHAPPKDTILDKVDKNEHVGSSAITGIIKRKKPILAISAHIHENSGVDHIGKTQVFYPGPAYSGYYGLVTIDKNRVKCETLRVND